MLHKAETRQSKRPQRARDLPIVTAVHWQGAPSSRYLCVYTHVRVFWAFPSFPRLPPLSFLSKSAPKNHGKEPFPASEDAGTLRHTADRVSHWLFYDSMLWTLTTRVYTCCNGR